jgi:hypothetical protein
MSAGDTDWLLGSQKVDVLLPFGAIIYVLSQALFFPRYIVL